jgi:DNA-directed RNA polymerase beta' subunit
MLRGLKKSNVSKLTGLTAAAPPLVSGASVIQTAPVVAVRESFNAEEAVISRRAREEAMKKLPEVMVVSTEFSTISWEEIEALSLVEVTRLEYDAIDGSLNDPRAGSWDAKLCITCRESNCVGHFLRRKFGKMIFDIRSSSARSSSGSISNTIKDVINVLTCMCTTCGRLLVDAKTIREWGALKYSGKERLKFIAAKCVNMPCSYVKQDPSLGDQVIKCGKNPEFIYRDTYIEFKAAPNTSLHGLAKYNNQIDSAEGAFYLLNQLSQKDAELIGFKAPNHPRNWIIQGILIIPPTLRPPRIDGTEMKQHRLTEAYRAVIQADIDLRLSLKDGTQKVREERYQKLVDAYRLVIYKSKEPRYGGDIKPIMELIKGKEGWLRKKAMGSRANYCARTVIGPDPTLKFGELSVPMIFAPILTVKETVQIYNIKRLTNLLNNDKITAVTQISGKYKGISRTIANNVGGRNAAVIQTLRIGDIVERHLQDGDFIMFNRQPTLHKQSQLAGKVVLRDQLHIGLHLAYSTPQGADFDGDEENLHSFRTFGSQAEAEFIASAPLCVMSAQQNRPIMGLVMDSLDGAYQLSDPTVRIPRDDFFQFLMEISNQSDFDTLDKRLKQFNVHPYSGRALISALFPAGFYYKKDDVLIIDGVMLGGLMSKEHLLTSHRSIIQDMWHDPDYGPARVKDFINDATFLFDKAATYFGLSVGLDDCMFGNKEIESISSLELAKIESEVDGINSEPVRDAAQEAFKRRRLIGVLDKIKSIGRSVVEKVAVIPNNIARAFVIELKSSRSDFMLDIKIGQSKIDESKVKIAEYKDKVSKTDDIDKPEDFGGKLLNTVKSWFDILSSVKRRGVTEYLSPEVLSQLILLNDQIKGLNTNSTLQEVTQAINNLESIIPELNKQAPLVIGPINDELITYLQNNRFKITQGFEHKIQNIIESSAAQLKRMMTSIVGDSNVSSGLVYYIKGPTGKDLKKVLSQMILLNNRSTYSDFNNVYNQLLTISPYIKDAAPISTNSFAIATEVGAGSKGSLANVAQVTTSVGQQFLAGDIIKPQLAGGTKCLSTYDENDPRIQSRGFCYSSYGQGLSPEESWYTFVAGRESLLDTALRTSVTGDLQRKLTKIIGENCIATFDGSIRSPTSTDPFRPGDSNNMLYQFVYGGDGFRADELMKIKAPGFSELAFFIDVEAVAKKMNSLAGWVPEDAKNPELKEVFEDYQRPYYGFGLSTEDQPVINVNVQTPVIEHQAFPISKQAEATKSIDLDDLDK